MSLSLQPALTGTFRNWEKERVNYCTTKTIENSHNFEAYHSHNSKIMPLNTATEEVNWPLTHFVYVGETGSFSETARACWGSFKGNEAAIASVTGGFVAHFSLYQIEPEMIYRAGASIANPPSEPLPEGVSYMAFSGGKYVQFTMTGCYSQLPVVVGEVFNKVKTDGVSVRADWYIEHYANNPASTPVDELITHILIPVH